MNTDDGRHGESDAHSSAETGERGLGRRGWALVGVVVVSTLVIPGAIYLFPAAPGRAGLPFLIAMLVLPFLPALLLGLVAVWSAGGDTAESAR